MFFFVIGSWRFCKGTGFWSKCILQHVISVVPLGEKLRCRHQSLIIASLLIFSLLSIEQTEDLKEIALKMSKLPKVNESRPRTVVITHGKEPAIVVKGNSKLFLTCPCSFGRPTQMAYTQIQLLFSSEQEVAWGHVHTNPNLFKKKNNLSCLPRSGERFQEESFSMVKTPLYCTRMAKLEKI